MGYIRASLHTERLRGSVSRSISVQTNDPAHANFNLILRAEILTSVTMLPGDRGLLTNRQAEPPVVRFLVRKEPSEVGVLEVTDLETSAPTLVATGRKLTTAEPAQGDLPEGQAGDWLVEVRPAPGAAPSRGKERVTFKTGLPRQPQAEFVLGMDFAPAIELSSKRLVLPRFTERSKGTAFVFVTVRAGLDAGQLRAEADPSSIHVELEPSGGGKFMANVSWDGEEAGRGTVTFHLGDETAKLAVVRQAPTASAPSAAGTSAPRGS